MVSEPLENSNMKKSILLLFLFCLSLAISAQPPQLIPYQAIARDNAGNPVLNQNIGLRFSIHDQTISGAVVWQESQTVVSNNVGIIVTALGGTTQLTSVDWGSGAKFLQVEMDIAGGTNYLDMGTQQMMSVPYALYAETSGSVVNSGSGNAVHIGDFKDGGIVFHVWRDSLNIEHGLISSLIEIPAIWGYSYLDIPNCESEFDGDLNTQAMLTFGSIPGTAAFECSNFSAGNFNDWYFPSYKEYELLANQRVVLNFNLDSYVGGVSDAISNFGLVSTETNNGVDLAPIYNGNPNSFYYIYRTSGSTVRPIRKF